MLISKIRGLLRDLELTRQCFMDRIWVRLFVNTVNELGQVNAGDMAAVISYYAFVSVFPLLLGVIALIGIFLPSEMIQRELFAFFSRNLPTSISILEDNISGIIKLRGTLGFLSVIGLLWAGSAIFDAIGRVVNRAWNIKQLRPFYIRKLRNVILTLGTSFLFLLSLGLTAAPFIVPFIELPLGHFFTVLLSELLAFPFMFGTFMLIYKFMPNTRIRWRDIWLGALLAAVLFEVIRNLFSFYITGLANYELVYGSIASIIVLLVWIYLSAFTLILGATFSSEYIKMKHNRHLSG